MKNIIKKLLAKRVLNARFRLTDVRRGITCCLMNMEYAQQEHLSVCEEYQFTEYCRLKKEEKKLEKFINKWKL